MKHDYQLLGRTYFPNVDMGKFTGMEKQQIENEIELDFKNALRGIKKLPPSSKHAVLLAYYYYMALFKKIKKLPAERILTERIRIPNSHKFRLMINRFVINKFLNWG